MYNFKERPYRLLLISAIILALVSITLKVLGIESHDTAFLLIPLMPILLISFWLLYLITKNLMYSKAIMLRHVILTVLTAVFVFVIVYAGFDPTDVRSRRYFDYHEMDAFRIMGITIQVILSILVAGQCLYFINLLLGISAIVRKKERRV